ncbi:Hypothetical protein IALB_3041 [Ignavibacterium album JCM 16511]|uniref:Uncharacterized protein n=1 Tax=Ignavibacterium album (strain DSM 19864 / JCM 16511 / NBRC 101810 / Mat9-16) TaxID=945713 RepID=I0AP37_IGNAJ|nr:hypothetical protein [Ignavibacterium album]AFH50744.1 Hypothetical protein IALB_3041 [Ignavibacterium album JCM 16511]
MQTTTNTYTINQQTYHLKNKYTLKDWGSILKILGGINPDDNNSIALLLTDNRVEDLLAIILDKPVEGDIYENDFNEVSRAINDFFTRKKSLMKNTSGSSIN